MLTIIGYYLGAFLFTWGLACLFTMGKVNKLQGEAKQQYKKERLIACLFIAFFVALIVAGMDMIAQNTLKK